MIIGNFAYASNNPIGKTIQADFHYGDGVPQFLIIPSRFRPNVYFSNNGSVFEYSRADGGNIYQYNKLHSRDEIQYGYFLKANSVELILKNNKNDTANKLIFTISGSKCSIRHIFMYGKSRGEMAGKSIPVKLPEFKFCRVQTGPVGQ